MPSRLSARATSRVLRLGRRDVSRLVVLAVVALLPLWVPAHAAAQMSSAATTGAVELILDTSGSMLQALPDGTTKVAAAKAVVTSLVTTTLQPGQPVALRVFGTQPGSCETNLAVPLQPLDPPTVAGLVNGVQVVNEVRTPIAASLLLVPQDLQGVSGPKVVVLVTDGEEDCGGDPGAAIRHLAALGIDVHVNIVGLALNDPALKAQYQEWAREGGGRYFDAASQAELGAAVTQALRPSPPATPAPGVGTPTEVLTPAGAVSGATPGIPGGTFASTPVPGGATPAGTPEVLTTPVSIKPVSGPPRVLMIFDTSGSIPVAFRGDGAVAFGTGLARKVLAAYPGAQFQIAASNFGVEPSGTWTSDLPTITNDLRHLGGFSSALWMTLADAGRFRATVIVFVTDGDAIDYLSPDLRAKIEAGPPAVMVGVGDVSTTRGKLAEMAQVSGGVAVTVQQPDEAERAVLAYVGEQERGS